MSRHTRWHFKPRLRLASKADPTWWVNSDRGHRTHTLIGLNLVDVYAMESDKAYLGQDLFAVVGPLRIGIAMRFDKAEVDSRRERATNGPA